MASCGTQSKTWLLSITTRPSISWLTTSANSALTTLFVSPCAPATLASLALQTGPTFLSQGLARAVPFTLEPSPPQLLTLCLPPPLHPLGLGLNVTSSERPPLTTLWRNSSFLCSPIPEGAGSVVHSPYSVYDAFDHYLLPFLSTERQRATLVLVTSPL